MMSTIVNIMKLCIAFVVLMKVAQSRFLQPEFPDNVPFYNYDQDHPIFTPHFHMPPFQGYRPILTYGQSRYPIYSYGSLDHPFSRKYRPYWIFRTKTCWPVNKKTTTDRNTETTTEDVITTEKIENTESNTMIVEEKTVNLFTSEAPTTVSQANEIATTAASKEQEESTSSNEDNIIPIDYDEPEAV